MAYIQSSTEDLWALAAVTVVSGVLISIFYRQFLFTTFDAEAARIYGVPLRWVKIAFSPDPDGHNYYFDAGNRANDDRRGQGERPPDPKEEIPPIEIAPTDDYPHDHTGFQHVHEHSHQKTSATSRKERDCSLLLSL